MKPLQASNGADYCREKPFGQHRTSLFSQLDKKRAEEPQITGGKLRLDREIISFQLGVGATIPRQKWDLVHFGLNSTSFGKKWKPAWAVTQEKFKNGVKRLQQIIYI